mgnify:CR=1 FL=1|jgi:hypothetical protein|tara:strand:- start:4228 stop:4551 length:324 start_codon:yes stop_codon:yes gene_type:complete
MTGISEYDYSFVENDSSEFYGIKLKGSSPYAGVVVVYGTVSIKESEDADFATLSFSYNVQEPGTFNADELEKSEEFKNYLGDLLSVIINTHVEEKSGNSESTTDTHS